MTDTVMERSRLPAEPVPRGSTAPDDPTGIPDLPGFNARAMRDLRAEWSGYSSEARQALWDDIQELLAALAQLEATRDLQRRKQQRRKNQKAITFLDTLLADPTPDAEQTETLAYLKAELPEHFA